MAQGGATTLLWVLAAAPLICDSDAGECSPITAERGEGEAFSIECPTSDDGLKGEIKILKANYGYNCNEQCKCGPSSGCMPCCSTGGPCCPSCLEPKGNDYSALAAACDGKPRCEYPGPNIGDPAGGCGKKYQYIYGCCGDENYELGGLQWGESILIAVLLLLTAYASIGIFLHSTGGQHRYFPHASFWEQLAGLVRDGVAFSFGRGRPATRAIDGSAEPNHTQPLLTHKDGGLGNSIQGQTVPEALGATQASAKPRELQEHREQRTHSSQQRIKVVGTSIAASRSPPPALILQDGAENSTQLKATLGKQGTVAAQITLSQIDSAEHHQVKEQLQGLGLSTKGSPAELKTRLAQARRTGSARTQSVYAAC